MTAFPLPPASHAQGPDTFILPTENSNLLDGVPSAFYMYVNRDFEGEKSSPWEGGMYGFVRGPVRENNLIAYRRFHEGVDIRPIRRDKNNIPLDPVVAVAPGRVVHTSNTSGHSNYGKYVVIEHIYQNCPYYTLYAHLREIHVQPNQKVSQGQEIAILGWTGSGLDLTRAHLHFEINLLVQSEFEGWYQKYIPPSSPNRHGIYNGLNLTGLNPAQFFLERQKNPALTLPQFISQQPWFFKVAIPNPSKPLELITRYPWLAGTAYNARPAAWEIAFTNSGFPVSATPINHPIQAPTVTAVQPSKTSLTVTTRGLLTGSQKAPRLTEAGLRLMSLIAYPQTF